MSSNSDRSERPTPARLNAYCGNRFFNSGLLVFKPSMRTLRRLLEVERWVNWPWNGHVPRSGDRWPDICAPRDDPGKSARLYPNKSNPLAFCRALYGPGKQPGLIAKACESHYTDQSIFNYAFPYHALVPGSFNDASRFDIDAAHIVHFVGEPKPWDSKFATGRAASPARFNASTLWRQRCSGHLARHA